MVGSSSDLAQCQVIYSIIYLIKHQCQIHFLHVCHHCETIRTAKALFTKSEGTKPGKGEATGSELTWKSTSVSQIYLFWNVAHLTTHTCLYRILDPEDQWLCIP